MAGCCPARAFQRHTSRVMLAVVAIPTDDAPPGAGSEFVQIGAGNRFEWGFKLGTDGGDVPQHVAHLIEQPLALFVGKLAVLVADDLFEFAGHLTSLTGQTEDGVNEIVAPVGIGRRTPGGPLVFVQSQHDGEGITGGVRRAVCGCGSDD